jgi:hypothetical protein
MTEKTQSHPSSDAPKAKLPRLTSDWVRYLLGFSISIAVGLAPYLGLVGVPLFTPLLSLIPHSVQTTAIPISIASMGIIAVFVQWRKRDPATSIEFRFAASLAAITLIIFLGLQMLAVVHIEVPAANQTISFAVGLGSPNRPPCEGLSREACIAQRLGFNEAVINGYFGDTRTSLTKLALVLAYIVFMSSFGWMVGLLLLRERNRINS